MNLWERPLKMKVNDSEFGRIGHSGTSHPSGRRGLAASPPKHTQSPLMDARPRLLAPKGLPLRQLLFCLQLCSSCLYPPTAAPVAAVTESRPLPAGALGCSPASSIELARPAVSGVGALITALFMVEKTEASRGWVSLPGPQEPGSLIPVWPKAVAPAAHPARLTQLSLWRAPCISSSSSPVQLGAGQPGPSCSLFLVQGSCRTTLLRPLSPGEERHRLLGCESQTRKDLRGQWV